MTGEEETSGTATASGREATACGIATASGREVTIGATRAGESVTLSVSRDKEESLTLMMDIVGDAGTLLGGRGSVSS